MFTDDLGEFWIDLNSPRAYVVERAGYVPLAREYKGCFEEIAIVFTERKLTTLQEFMRSEGIIELETLAGLSFEEKEIGILGGGTGKLKLRRVN